MDSFVRLENAVKVYHTGDVQLTALDSISATFARGQFSIVVGKSGAGKSTLVNMIGGVDNLTSGQLWVGETAVHDLSEDERARWRGRSVGVIYQSFELLSQISVLDNVLLPMDFCGVIPVAERLPRALELLSQMEISDHAHKLPGMVSGGQKQRVAIARAMANDPELLLADEPTGNLDSTTSAVIYSLFRKLVMQGRTVIMVTHDRSAVRHADRMFELRDGRLAGLKQPGGAA
ncbi:MAG: ABC transporter ATP-binding protein [Anaerolineales bacterium]|nr:ABC transporter ATP-binding protein [Anaerolineales bacterium]